MKSPARLSTLRNDDEAQLSGAGQTEAEEERNYCTQRTRNIASWGH